MTAQDLAVTQFAGLISNLRRDTRGNVIMIFALSLFVLMGFIGAAIDLSRVNDARHRIQDAADIAVLRTMPMKSSTDSARSTAALQAFGFNFSHPGVTNITGDLKRSVAGSVISETYTVHAVVSSYFGAFFGKKDYPVTVVSEAKTALDVFEIAMVLDSTGSMADADKMPNLKTSVDSALAGLLDETGKNASGSKVAIVPFNTQVRLANGDLSSLQNLGLSSGGGGNCVVDRNQPNYDISGNAAIKGQAQTLYPIAGCDQYSLQPIKSLSTDIASSRSFIKTLQPGGYTNITVGVQWGMEVLSPNQPFTGAVPFGDTSAKKFMIVVTDGDNTKNRWSWDPKTIDKRTAAACKDAKARGITLYTVKVIEGNSDMLRACASKPEYFYDLTKADQLNSTMAGIFKSINKTRLSM